MMQRIGSVNSDDSDGNSNSRQLLRDIEAISKALYLQKTPPLISKPTVRSKSVEKSRLSQSKSSLNPRNVDSSVSFKDKKSTSMWNWKKPLKALAHIGRQKYNICFFLHVHSIEGLPLGFNGMNLSVHWKRKDEVLQTFASKVENGASEFDETLMHKCTVYGSKSGPHNSAKYEAKFFLIYVSVIGAPLVDMGKHWVDLTRLLPVTLEELEGQKSTGKWTTSFKLAGKGKGATLNVSLGFSIVRENLIQPRTNMYVSELVQSSTVEQRPGYAPGGSNGMLRRVGSVPSSLSGRYRNFASEANDGNIRDEYSPNMGLELSKSIDFLYQKLHEVNPNRSGKPHNLSEHVAPDKEIDGNDNCSTEFTVIEQGIEFSKKDSEVKGGDFQSIDDPQIETINVDDIFKDDDIDLNGESNLNSEDNICKTGSSREELEFAFNSFLTSKSAELESPITLTESFEQESTVETESNQSEGTELKRSRSRSLSLDELTESVATDFLNMLSLEDISSVPESPRERLLREFEEEALTSGIFIVDYDENTEEFNDSDIGDLSRDFNFPITMNLGQEGYGRESQLLSRRRKAKMLEDLETEDLMKQWGLNEDAFQSSPRYCSDGFGSPVEILPEERFELPPLGDGFGHLILIKNGGYLRSMNPSLFRNSKNVGNLIMQVSVPVVLPAELGSDIIEILQHLASIGIGRFSNQVKKLMPLEDITGKTLQQIAQDDSHVSAVPIRQTPLRRELLFEEGKILDAEMGLDYVTLESLPLLVMDKIEPISIEGLKVQSSLSEVAPSSIGSKPIGKIPPFEDSQTPNYVERLLESAITLDEWLTLDNGSIGNNRTVEVLAAHHAKSTNFNDPNGELITRHGLLGDNLTVAVMTLLRDPLRNYEPVGAPMLGLVQVERSFFEVKPRVDRTILSSNGDEDNEMEDEYSFGFKITEVNLSGLTSEPGKTHWGTKTQQQYGTRWLLASGMCKSSRHSNSKSRAIVLSQPMFMRKVENNGFLWSMSCNDNGSECSWKELDGFGSYVRNPNVVFP